MKFKCLWLSPTAPGLNTLDILLMTSQPLLKKDGWLKVVMCDKPVLVYRQPPRLKQSLSSNRLPHSWSHQGTRPCNTPNAFFAPTSMQTTLSLYWITWIITSGVHSLLIPPTSYTPSCAYSAVYIGEGRESLHDWMNEHQLQKDIQVCGKTLQLPWILHRWSEGGCSYTADF